MYAPLTISAFLCFGHFAVAVTAAMFATVLSFVLFCRRRPPPSPPRRRRRRGRGCFISFYSVAAATNTAKTWDTLPSKEADIVATSISESS